MAEESIGDFVAVLKRSLGEHFYRQASLGGDVLHIWLRCNGPAPVLSVVKRSKQSQLSECSFHEIELTLRNITRHRDGDLGFECSLKDFGMYFSSAIRDNITIRESTGEYLGLELSYSDLDLVGVLQLATLMPYVTESILRLLLAQHEVIQRKNQPEGDEVSQEPLDDNARLVDNAASTGGTGGSSGAMNVKKRPRVAGGNIFNPGTAKRKGKGAKIKK